MKFTVEHPLRLRNPLNGSQGRSRGGAIMRSKERARLREIGKLLAGSRIGGLVAFPERWAWRITLTRIGKRRVSAEGICAAFKSVRDGVSDALGYRDDDHPALTWIYAQETGPYGIRIVLEVGERRE